MIDSYWWNFAGTGYEDNGETRVRPNPGFHFYEFSQTRMERLENLLGIQFDPGGDGGGGFARPGDAPWSAYNP